MTPIIGPRLWGARSYVMGVLNLTPDSFSDGGRFNHPEAAMHQALLMRAQGADLVDLGGQSTRPGAAEISAEQEMARVLPALRRIVEAFTLQGGPDAEHQNRGRQPGGEGSAKEWAGQASVPSHPGSPAISIDTFRAAVAESALAAGAQWINDVSGGRRDPAILKVAAAATCPFVLTHSRGDSRSMDDLARYDDVVEEVRGELLRATEAALAAGIRSDRLIWDPGLGFAKNTSHNLLLLRGLPRLKAEGFPLLVGPSRKRFIGEVLGEPRPRARLWGTAAVCGQAIAAGADILRVHDVAPIVQTCRMADALWR